MSDALTEFLSDANRRRVFLQEKSVVDYSELVCGIMLDKGVTIEELAEAAGMGKAALIDLLDTGRIDPRRMAKLLFYLGFELRYSAVPIER